MKEETDFYIYLCNIAGSLLQGGPLELEGKTYVGDEARKKGMQIRWSSRIRRKNIRW